MDDRRHAKRRPGDYDNTDSHDKSSSKMHQGVATSRVCLVEVSQFEERLVSGLVRRGIVMTTYATL